MLVRKLRLQRGWTQSQLAEMAGVTTRTIQRVEQGHRPSLETCKALASVFEVDLSTFQTEETHMNTEMNANTETDRITEATLNAEEQEAMTYAKRIKDFYQLLAMYVFMAAIFLYKFAGEPRVMIVFGVLGIAVIIQGLIAYEVINFVSPKLEKKLIEKRLGRKL